MSSSSPSILPALPGYVYDSVLNRFFKCPSHSNRAPSARTSLEDHGNPAIRLHEDGPPTYSFQLRSHPTSPSSQFDPEIHPGSPAKRARYHSRALYRGACLGLTGSIHHLTTPPAIYPAGGRISRISLSPLGDDPSNPILIIGTSSNQGLLCDLRSLIDGQSVLSWASIALPESSPISEFEPITSIVSRPGAVCFAATSGCTVTRPIFRDGEQAPKLLPVVSFPGATWSTCLTARHLLMGSDHGSQKLLRTYDHHSQAVAVNRLQSSVFAIESQDMFNFLLGTRSGHVIRFDQRAPLLVPQRGLLDHRSIYHLKLLDDNQILLVGTMNYAKLHDLRYLTSDPTMSLDDWENICDASLGITISKDKNLICMPGRDRSIKVWDLKSDPVPGLGLRPIAQHHTHDQVTCVKFIDDLPPHLWPSARGSRSPGTVGKPCGPGILFGDGYDLQWLGPAIRSG